MRIIKKVRFIKPYLCVIGCELCLFATGESIVVGHNDTDRYQFTFTAESVGNIVNDGYAEIVLDD